MAKINVLVPSAANVLVEWIIPLPIGQRYGKDEMIRIMEVVNG